jgi:HEAT repeat protein
VRTALLLLAAALPAAAQPKKLVNAQVDTRSAAAGLESVFRQLMTAQPQPAWIAYTVPAARGRQFGCDSYWRDGEFTVAGGTVHLEPPSEADCDIDAGGVPVHWLTDVRPAESVALLATFVTGQEHSAMSAIGLHADPSADAALEKFVAPDQPESIRQRAVIWLRSFDALKRIVETDPSDRVRDRALQTLSMRKEPAAIDLVIATARNDRSPRVRGQALFALARQAGTKAVGPIQQAIENDPEREVKRRAVSALQHLPNGEGIPLLIQLAKTSHNAEVRKQAMSSLAQSRDQRAVVFFEDVLKSKP